jgi:hypothetical protein
MSYFSHAFKKTFVMSSYSQPDGSKTTADLTKGEVSIFNSKTWANVLPPSGAEPCCPFIIAAGAPYTNDKIGPFHGGYKESIKSKGINSRYVTKVWNSFASEAQAAVLHVGTTVWTQEGADGETAGCCPEFLCGENYHLRVDVKGSPALRMLNHQGYVEVTAYGGCCPDDAIDPVAVNPADIMIQWAKGLWESVVVTGNGPNFNPSNPASADRVNPNPFFVPVVNVTDNVGAVTGLLFPPGWLGVYGPTAAQVATQAGLLEANVTDWDSYTIPAMETGICGGLTLTGAYEETKFGTCTFQPSDFYGLEPVRLYASEVDLNGDPCAFTGICVVNECLGKQAQGLGETALRDFILSESYRQNPFATDLRIREITQGTDMIDSIGGVYKDKLYDRLLIQHTVPRYNNPSGTFDNDQYVIEILTEADSAINGPGSQARALLVSDLNATFSTCGESCIDIADGSTVDCPAVSIPVVPRQVTELL